MKHIATAAVGMLAAIAASAAPLSPEQALSRATGEGYGANQAPSIYTLAETRMVASEPAFYMFTSHTGFLIASADDRLRPCLAEGVGTFDPDNLPCNVEMWLDNYAEEIGRYLSQTPAAPQMSAANSPALAARTDIEPICKTMWDQKAPYFNNTPVVNGTHCVTGCGATAMAQIMKSYNYPEHGIGSTTYENNGITLSANFAEATYEWDNMIDSYSLYYTPQQGAAVAKLMSDCGISLRMQYTPSISGSYEHMIPYALTTNFGYDADNILMVYRSAYPTQEEWDELIYESLASGCPVQYNGQTSGGAGHSFVCDGYSADGLFHINWGWSGYCDGYYALSALNPAGQGTGGAAGGYNMKQSAVIGIRPTPEGKPTGSYSQIVGSGDFTYDGVQFRLSSWIINYAPVQNTFSLGVMIVAPDGTTSYFISDSEYTLASSEGDGSTDWYARQPRFSVTPSGLAPGTYRVYPAVRQKDGTPHQLPLESGKVTMLYLTVDANGGMKYSTTAPVSNARLTIKSFGSIDGNPLQPGVATDCRLVVSNEGTESYISPLYYSVDAPLSYTTSEHISLNLAPGAEINIDMSVNVTAGVHRLYVGDAYLGDIVGSPYRIVCGATDALVVPDAITPSGTFYEGMPLQFNVDLTNVGAKDFDGKLNFGVFAAGGTEPVTTVELPVTLASGASVTIETPEIPANNLGAGSYYACILDANGGVVSDFTSSFVINNIAELRLVEVSAYAETLTTFKVDVTLQNNGPGTYQGPALITVTDASGEEKGRAEANIDIAEGRRQRVWVTGLVLPNGTFNVDVTTMYGTPAVDSGLTFEITSSGIESVTKPGAVVCVDGLSVSVGETEGVVSLLRPDGTLVARGEAPATLAAPQPGLYILVFDGSTHKIVLR